MSRIVAIAVLSCLTAACTTEPDRRTQLEAAAGISPQEAGVFSRAEVLVIMSIQNNDELNEGEKARRINSVRRGYSPAFVFGN